MQLPRWVRDYFNPPFPDGDLRPQSEVRSWKQKLPPPDHLYPRARLPSLHADGGKEEMLIIW